MIAFFNFFLKKKFFETNLIHETNTPESVYLTETRRKKQQTNDVRILSK